MKEKTKTEQASNVADDKKISVSAIIFYLLTLLVFFSAMGMLAVYLRTI